MKIRFIETVAGIGFVYVAGQVVDLSPHEAEDWIGQKLAEKVKETKAKPVTVQQVKAITRPVLKKVKK
jgi:hypothetical protein